MSVKKLRDAGWRVILGWRVSTETETIPITVLESRVPEGDTPSYAAASETLKYASDAVTYADDGPREAVTKLAAEMRLAVVEILAPEALSRGELLERHRKQVEGMRVARIDSKGGDDFFLCDGGDSEQLVVVELVMANELSEFEQKDEQNCVGFMQAVSKGHFKRALSFWDVVGEAGTYYSTNPAPFLLVDPDELKARAKAWMEAYKERTKDKTEE